MRFLRSLRSVEMDVFLVFQQSETTWGLFYCLILKVFGANLYIKKLASPTKATIKIEIININLISPIFVVKAGSPNIKI